MPLYRPTVTRKRTDGTKYKQKSKTWVYWFIHPATGERVTKSTRTRDKTAAMAVYTDARRAAEAEAEQAAQDARDPKQKHARRSVTEHLDDWDAYLHDFRGNTRKHARTTTQRVRRVFKKCSYTTWADCHVDLISEAVVSFGLAARTRGYYMRDLRAFARWMRKSGRAAASPLEDLPSVPKDSIRKDPRHARRWLDADERRKFYNAARNGPPVFGISGADRERLYVTAATTGLRANECRGMTWADFQTGPDRPTMTIRAMVAKNSELVTLPLNRDTAALLRAWRAERENEPDAAPVFRMPNELKLAEMMRTDLTTAGIPYTDDAGRYADFHSLRHTFGVTLARAGVPPKTLKELMRHSTITLTMDLYAAAGVSISDQSAAVDLATTPPEAESVSEAA